MSGNDALTKKYVLNTGDAANLFLTNKIAIVLPLTILTIIKTRCLICYTLRHMMRPPTHEES